MQTSMIQVHEYFKCHLQRRSWQELPKDTQTAAVKMAEEDIMLALDCSALDTGDLLIFCAICEQALFLALAEMNRQTHPVKHGSLKSETIEGIGKREYFENPADCHLTPHNPAIGHLAPRCELFLSRLPGYGETRFLRG